MSFQVPGKWPLAGMICALALSATSGANAAETLAVKPTAPLVSAAPSTALKTPLPKAATLVALVNGLHDLDAAIDANGGKAPLDAKRRLEALRTAAAAAKLEVGTFAKKLKAAGEVPAYDAYIAARVKQDGTPGLAEGLKASGGGYATLLKFDAEVDAILVGAAGTPGLAASDLLLRAIGIADANAGLKRGACTFVMWVATVGTSPDAAYKLCNRY